MRKIIIYLILLQSTFCFSQEFQPGSQAMGYLENKGIMVDYSTGIFNYSLPLLEVGSGNYSLPINLNYIGKGVQSNADYEILGHNWNLQAGGVVTRIIRGLPDEDPFNGILRSYEKGENYNRSDIHALKKDGENDIYMTSFNGKKIPFIIVYDSNIRKFRAEPLIKTNVRIELVYSLSTYGAVYQFNITDTDGVVYSFSKIGNISNLVYTDISHSYVAKNSYAASWYLTKIKPVNGDEIKLEYIDESKISYKGTQETAIVPKKYIYSKPLTEPNYQGLTECIESTTNTIKQMANEAPWDLRNYYIGIGYEYNNITKTMINHLADAAGTLRNLEPLRMELESLQELATNLIAYYTPFYHLETARAIIDASNNMNDKIYLFLAGREMLNVKEKHLGTRNDYSISPVLLKSIESSGQIVEFDYEITDYISMHICHLKTITSTKNTFPDKKINFNYKYQKPRFLDNISISGPDNNQFAGYAFSYYDFSPEASRTDDWGFYNYHYEDVDITTPWYIKTSKSGNLCPAKRFSLQSITNAYGGKIEIEYEKNTVYYAPINQDAYYGGIRIKELRLHDKNGSLNRIRYKYPLSGRLLYQDCVSMDIINYQPGSIYVSAPETVFRDRVNLIGNAYINTGNNGIIYPCVQEITEGKGITAYFFESDVSSNISTASYPFWMVGLPIMKMEFDEQNKLRNISTLEYTTSVMPFNKQISQRKAYEYYIDREEILREISKDDSISVLTSLNYSVNILPRTNAIAPSHLDYSMQYGGKVLLKEQKQYEINECNQSAEEIIRSIGSGNFNINNFNTTLHKHQEYCYDNPNNPNPTRILSYQSNGDIIAEKNITPLEYNGSDPVITGMKTTNIIFPNLSKQKLLKKKGASSYILMNEQVTMFDKLTDPDGNISVFLPVKMIETPSLFSLGISVSPSSSVTSITTRPLSEYRDINTLSYEHVNGTFVPKEKVENEVRTVSVYDSESGNSILTLSPTSTTQKKQIDAMSLIPENKDYNGYPAYNNELGVLYARTVCKFYNYLKQIDINSLPPIYNSLFIGNNFDIYNSFLGIIERFGQQSSYQELMAYATPSRLFEAEAWMMIFMYTYTAEPIMEFSGNELGYVNGFLMDFDTNISEDYYNFYKEINSSKYFYQKKKGKLEVSGNACTYQVFVLQKGSSKILYKTNNGSVQTKDLYPASANDSQWIIHSFEIAAGANSTVTVGVESFQSKENVAYIMIIPKGESFLASYFDKNERLICEFNQNKQATYYEYDGADRIIETYLVEKGTSNLHEKKLIQQSEYSNKGVNTTLE